MREHFDEEFSLEQMEQETEAMLRLRYLTPETAQFARTVKKMFALIGGLLLHLASEAVF